MFSSSNLSKLEIGDRFSMSSWPTFSTVVNISTQIVSWGKAASISGLGEEPVLLENKITFRNITRLHSNLDEIHFFTVKILRHKYCFSRKHKWSPKIPHLISTTRVINSITYSDSKIWSVLMSVTMSHTAERFSWIPKRPRHNFPGQILPIHRLSLSFPSCQTCRSIIRIAL